jgi:magnesium chelatase family protein
MGAPRCPVPRRVTEFRRDAVEGLRQPLEDGRVVVTRMMGSVVFPSRFTLVAAAKPCPCGFAGDAAQRCSYREDRLQTYRGRDVPPRGLIEPR